MGLELSGGRVSKRAYDTGTSVSEDLMEPARLIMHAVGLGQCLLTARRPALPAGEIVPDLQTARQAAAA